ncbi:MAG TPA: cyclic nucleotide-binding domain-containing protein [Vicinamibacterales bacterium]|nr:cyclic nucleotide-binding domain-containing protein [Vicinamibacterales bacterium]
MASRENVPSLSLILPKASVGAARQFSAFTGGLDERGGAIVAGRLHHVSLPAGGLLFRQGEPGDAVYFVITGRLAVHVMGDDGREIRVAEVSPGDVVGEMALVSDEPRLASARALRDCSLLRLSKTAYEALLTHEADAVAPFAEAISDRVARTARTRQAIAAIRSSTPVTLEECAALASPADPAAIDAGIRQLCHRLATDLVGVLGAQDVNWFAFVCRSLRCSGLPGRDDLPMLPAAARAAGLVLPGPLVARLRERRAIAAARAAWERVNTRVAEGARQLLSDIAPAFVQLIEESADEAADRRGRGAARPPAKPLGRGQELVAQAIRLYGEASAETEPAVRSELILLGTTKLAWFEQLRLERLVTEAVDEAMSGLVRSAIPSLARLPGSRRIEERLQRFVNQAARRLVWSRLNRVRLSPESLRRGDDLPPKMAPPGAGPLSTLGSVELSMLLTQFERGRGTQAVDWSDLSDRMRYLTSVFRAEQRNLALFEPPLPEEVPAD